MTTSHTDPSGQQHYPDVLGVLRGQDSPRIPWDSPLDPRDHADAVRAACPCGWRGPVLAPVPIPDTISVGPGSDLDQAATAAWEQHRAEVEQLM